LPACLEVLTHTRRSVCKCNTATTRAFVPELLYELSFGDPRERELSLCNIHVLSLVIVIIILVRVFIVSILQGEISSSRTLTFTFSKSHVSSVPAVKHPTRKQTTLRRSSQKLSCLEEAFQAS
jgi:hypothetical protein